jgi:hypothetical protein
MDTHLKGHYVMVRAGTLRLLLPQASVGAAEYGRRNYVPTPHRGVFAIEVDGTPEPAMAASEFLTPLADMPRERFVLTRFGEVQKDPCWLAWDEVRVFIEPQFALRSLPVALRSPGMPVTSYVEYAGDIMLCANGSAVLSYLRAQTEVPA